MGSYLNARDEENVENFRLALGACLNSAPYTKTWFVLSLTEIVSVQFAYFVDLHQGWGLYCASPCVEFMGGCIHYGGPPTPMESADETIKQWALSAREYIMLSVLNAPYMHYNEFIEIFHRDGYVP